MSLPAPSTVDSRPARAAHAAAGGEASLRLEDDDFRIFGLPAAQGLDRAELDTRWRSLQAQAHPDRHAGAGAAAQRVAMQWSVRINEAYRRLKDPLARAAYLCELRGVPVQTERHAPMPPAFLAEQMAWRERLEEAMELASSEPARSAAHVQALHEEARQREAEGLAQLQVLLDSPAAPAEVTAPVPAAVSQAAHTVRATLFVRRFREELERQLERLEG